MPWFKVDDRFADHRKVAALQDAVDDDMVALAAIGLWTLTGVYSMRTLTDGRLSLAMLRKATAADRKTIRDLAQRLVDVGLWERDGDEFVFHDWLDMQPSAAHVLAERARAAERKRRSRKRSRSSVTSDEVTEDVTAMSQRDSAVSHGAVTAPPDPDPDPDPDPEYPDLDPTPEENTDAGARDTRCPVSPPAAPDDTRQKSLLPDAEVPPHSDAPSKPSEKRQVESTAEYVTRQLNAKHGTRWQAYSRSALQAARKWRQWGWSPERALAVMEQAIAGLKATCRNWPDYMRPRTLYQTERMRAAAEELDAGHRYGGRSPPGRDRTPNTNPRVGRAEPAPHSAFEGDADF